MGLDFYIMDFLYVLSFYRLNKHPLHRKQPGQSTPEEVGLNTFIKGLKECAATCTVKDDVDTDKARAYISQLNLNSSSSPTFLKRKISYLVKNYVSWKKVLETGLGMLERLENIYSCDQVFLNTSIDATAADLSKQFGKEFVQYIQAAVRNKDFNGQLMETELQDMMNTFSQAVLTNSLGIVSLSYLYFLALPVSFSQ